MITPTGAGSRPALWSPAFGALLLAVFLGFASFQLLAPVIPVIILEQGGDATAVGIVVAAFSIPSVILRPPIGRLVDEWSRRGILSLGLAGMVASSLLYVIPLLPVMLATRLLHGTAWAAFNTGSNSTLAEIAPAARRGEASGLFSLMPALANTAMPAVGILLLGFVGTPMTFLVATAIALAGLLVATRGPRPEEERRPRAAERSTWRSLIERSSLLPMLLEFLWMTTHVLFFIYPPVWAAEKGIPVSALVLYYPAVGLALVISRAVAGRRLDRVPRGVPILIGIGCGAVALGVASMAESVAMLVVAGVTFAIGASMTSSMHMAIAIDRAEPARRGAAMATYSLGYQLGYGVGSVVAGTLIARLGFPSPFLAGLLAMGAMALLVLQARRTLLAGDRSS